MNDGGIYTKGRWWAGTMSLDEASGTGWLGGLENTQVMCGQQPTLTVSL